MVKGRGEVAFTGVSDSFAQLLKLCRREEEDVPKGWHTAQEVSSKLGITVNAATGRLRILAQVGKAELRVFRRKVSGQIRPVRYFRLKP